MTSLDSAHHSAPVHFPFSALQGQAALQQALLLVAVLLSAQCTDKRVNLVTPHLWKLADTPEKMMRVPVAEIQRVIRPCGLSPQKALPMMPSSMACWIICAAVTSALTDCLGRTV